MVFFFEASFHTFNYTGWRRGQGGQGIAVQSTAGALQILGLETPEVVRWNSPIWEPPKYRQVSYDRQEKPLVLS